MINLAYDIIKDLATAYHSGERKVDLQAYFIQLAKDEARFNLDMLDVITRSLVNERSDQLAKACSCLRCELPGLFSAAGILPSDIFAGEHQFKHDIATFAVTDESEKISFQDKLKTQTPLYLYYFTYRKIDVLRALGSVDVNPSDLINLKVRCENIQIGLCQFLQIDEAK